MVNRNILRSDVIKHAYDKLRSVYPTAALVFQLDYNPRHVNALLDYLAGYTTNTDGIEYMLNDLQIDIDISAQDKNKLAREKIEKIIASMKDGSFSYCAKFIWSKKIAPDVPKGAIIPIDLKKLPANGATEPSFAEEIYEVVPDLDISRTSMMKYIKESTKFSKIEGFFFFFEKTLTEKEFDYILKSVCENHEFNTNVLETDKRSPFSTYERYDAFQNVESISDYKSKMVAFYKRYTLVE